MASASTLLRPSITRVHLRTYGDSACGFTLVEVLLSLAMVVLLLLGIARIFDMTASTVHGGIVIGRITRDFRNVMSTLSDDNQHMLSLGQTPFVLIDQQEVAAYLDGNDNIEYANYRGNLGLTGNMASVYPKRRADTLEFFVHGSYHRQTGQIAGGTFPQALVGKLTSNDAFVRWSHCNVPPLTPAVGGQMCWFTNYVWRKPGNGSNYDPTMLHNEYARNWVLCRWVYLMVQPNQSGTILGDDGLKQSFIIDGASNLDPLQIDSAATAASAPGYVQIDWPVTLAWDPTASPASKCPAVGATVYPTLQNSLNDVVGISISQYRSRVRTFQTSPASALTKTLNGTTEWRSVVNSTIIWNYPNAQPWFDGENANNPGFDKDIIQQTALNTPCMLNGVSEFIVEYAGDFLNQDDSTTPADATKYKTDGKIDLMDKDHDRRIRFYGLPRDTKGDGMIDPSRDVVPLSWFFPPRSDATPFTPPPQAQFTPFEHAFKDGNASVQPFGRPYWDSGSQAAITTGPSGNAAWPATPSGMSVAGRPVPYLPMSLIGNASAVGLNVEQTHSEPAHMLEAWGTADLGADASTLVPNSRPPSLIRVTIHINDPLDTDPQPREIQYIIDLRK